MVSQEMSKALHKVSLSSAIVRCLVGTRREPLSEHKKAQRRGAEQQKQEGAERRKEFELRLGQRDREGHS